MRTFIASLLLLVSGSAAATCGSCQAIATKAAASGFEGVVLVSDGQGPAFRAAYGNARVDPDVPLDTATAFPTGSFSKWVTSIVVMRLVEQGLLSLDQPVSHYLPDYPKASGDKVTLLHLLTHSSGIPNDVDKAIKGDPAIRNLTLDTATAIRRFASSPLAFEPGTQWDYSHSNWILLEGVIERATGSSYGNLVRSFLTEPLALRHSGVFSGMPGDIPAMATGFKGTPSTTSRVDKKLPPFMTLAGGYYTSADDMLSLLDALFSGRILKPESVRTLMTVVRPQQSYALGGRTKVLEVAGKPRTVAWEYGSDGAYRVLAWRVIDDGHTVIVMNHTSFDHMKIGDLATALLGASYEESR
ncbi:serine hydrolase domain-containing protein [Luteibacter sp. Lutesp34]|uniref:serine hydrolase domain-containing protein n=1 Tax=Luteibacter sp. Lutesp34 TaxID=3243030 RepID=UPI0039B675E7